MSSGCEINNEPNDEFIDKPIQMEMSRDYVDFIMNSLPSVAMPPNSRKRHRSDLMTESESNVSKKSKIQEYSQYVTKAVVHVDSEIITRDMLIQKMSMVSMTK